ncbi:hypothetical protein H206_05399 [Candidatus Electrothrix aarhusensis]|uniref:Uncharacterized protein n=1 Tax=Candidatus Electrothrix aarhusensis TaxID=1859131 RepID=A0A444J4K8_9BACT|nr:hypothetical protein H206_05399 [Candidatus Electrothrix aarhusensis]
MAPFLPCFFVNCAKKMPGVLLRADVFSALKSKLLAFLLFIHITRLFPYEATS